MNPMTVELARQVLEVAEEKNRAAILLGSTDAPQEVQVVDLPPLDTAMLETRPFEINFSFRSVYVSVASDTSTEIKMRVNSQDSVQGLIPLRKGDSLVFPKSQAKAFLHWDAQPGKIIKLIFFVSGEFRSGSHISQNAGGISISDGESVMSNAYVSVGTSATEVLAQDTDRKTATIQNQGTGNIWLGGSDVTDSSGAKPGILLGPGQSFIFKNTATLYGVAAGAAVPEIAVMVEK